MHCEIEGTQGPLGYISACGATRLVHWLIPVAPSCLQSHNAQYIMLKSSIIMEIIDYCDIGIIKKVQYPCHKAIPHP